MKTQSKKKKSRKKSHDILLLKPTQFAVGLLEIQTKVEEIEKMSKSEKKKLIRDNPIPVVISPHGELYLVDHHHLLFACWHVGIPKARVKVLEDLSGSKLSFRQFWRWMKKNNYYYPYCQFGEGPRNPLYLPGDIRGLGDDPYRSLAWFARKEGAYENTDKTFAEFHWANFFRDRKLLDRHGRRGFDQAIKKAMRLARSRAASRLPGFIGKK